MKKSCWFLGTHWTHLGKSNSWSEMQWSSRLPWAEETPRSRHALAELQSTLPVVRGGTNNLRKLKGLVGILPEPMASVPWEVRVYRCWSVSWHGSWSVLLLTHIKASQSRKKTWTSKPHESGAWKSDHLHLHILFKSYNTSFSTQWSPKWPPLDVARRRLEAWPQWWVKRSAIEGWTGRSQRQDAKVAMHRSQSTPYPLVNIQKTMENHHN